MFAIKLHEHDVQNFQLSRHLEGPIFSIHVL